MENASLDPPSPWYIGHHDSLRGLPVTDSLLHQAQDANYDMVTSPVTTTYFKSNVQNLVSTYYKAAESSSRPDELPVPLVPALKPVDSTLIPNDSISQLVLTTASWIDLASSDPVIANVSQQVFNLEVAYAAFCGSQHVIVPVPPLGTAPRLAQFSRAILEALSIGPYIQFHMLLPMGLSRTKTPEDPAHLSRFAEHNDDLSSTVVSDWTAWELWNAIRQFCSYHGRLSVALQIAKQLPQASVIERWASEPLRILIIPNTTFIPNKHNQPVFSKSVQNLIYRYMRLRSAPWLILADVGAIPVSNVSALQHPQSPSSSEAGPWPLPSETNPKLSKVSSIASDPTPHLSYVRHLQSTQPPKPPIERFGAGYQDYLQAPLQPLADNLESITYEVFEKDPIKYEWYERAIAHALMDWSTEAKPTSSGSGAVVIAVVGSGRGPLVTRALRASQTTDVPVEVWAIEKNPNAYVLLQRHNELEWDGKVTVVKTDMRAWKGPLLSNGTHGHVDILVSELLGSFADNELSPECLDGVQHVLNPFHGISIPASYTAHLTPISTPKLHADLLHKNVADKDAFDLPYVVMFHQHDYLSILPSSSVNADLPSQPVPDVQTCWEFKHPVSPSILAQSNLRRGGSEAGGFGGGRGGDGANEHNARSCALTFQLRHRGTCHGLAGYFETVLYTSTDLEEDEAGGIREATPISIELSTNPVTMNKKSKDMISWFPIFFPLKTPVSFPDNAEMKVSMWRATDDRKVWYEWCVEVFIVLPSGEKVRIGGGDVQRSIKNGCLM